MSKNEIILSNLGHTWLFDIDGTIVKHNGYLLDGHDTILPGVKEVFSQIPAKDFIIFVTSRKKEYSKITEEFLLQNGLRFNAIIYDVPYGERILVNDDKPSGLKMGIAISKKRDQPLDIAINEDSKL